MVNETEYFFFEWMIICKNMNAATFAELSSEEYEALWKEYQVFLKAMK